MITNLFSIFDPTISLFSTSWIVLMLVLIVIPSLYWASSMLNIFLLNFFLLVSNEVNYTLSNPINGAYNTISSIFILIATINFIALFPFIFSTSSHLAVTLPISYSLWIGIIIFCWIKSINNFLSHLIPAGTPTALISFIVIVEILSNLIRPLALTFRITANILAGHLLIGLVGGFLVTLPPYSLTLGSVLQSFLVFIEIGVSIIQAYVFSTLLLLYFSESEN